MLAPSPSTDELLWEVANRAQEQVLEAINSLDAKAGALLDVCAIVAGLFVVTGFAIPDLARASCIAYRDLAFASLAAGFATAFGAFLVSLDIPPLVRKLESAQTDYARAFIVSQLSHQFSRNVGNYERQKRRIRAGMAILGASVAAVGVFITFASLALGVGC